MKSRLLVFALFAATAGAVIAHHPMHAPTPLPVKPVPAVAAKKPKVEAVFVLDTTGSMSGLIQAAKENIWSIATSMAQAQPAPEIKIGLVPFRDRGDEYVTRVIDLSSDLDTMYATLMDFQANGGGDGPESVNQALHDAVHKVSWSQDQGSYRVIFLVGDAPPHMDYQDDVKYPETLKAARAKGIVVNTIQAGEDPSTKSQWQQIASLNQGAYLKVGQTGSAVAVATPFDAKLAALSKELDDTRLFFGDADTRREMKAKEAAADKLHALGSEAAQAKRAAFNASGAGDKNLLGDNELVDAVTSGRVALDKVAPAMLPEPIRALDKKEQEKVIKDTAEKRSKLRDEIAQLSRQRQEHIAEQLRKDDSAAASLDKQVFETVREQAGKKGLKYEKDAAY